MMKKRQIILLLLMILTILFIALYNQDYFTLSKSDTPEIEEPFGDTIVTLEDYKVYDLLDVPFRFILADIKIANIRPISFELSRFQTDERIQLNSIDDYRAEIARKGYDLGKVNVVTQLTSNANELEAKILIPVINSTRQRIGVSISGLKSSELSFDLTKATGKPEDLGVTVTITEDNVAEDKFVYSQNPYQLDNTDNRITNSMYVTSANMVSKELILYKGLEGYHRVDFGTQSRILLLGITFDYEYDVTISAARITFVDKEDVFFALGQEWAIENGNNVLNKTVRQESGSLIFQTSSRIYDMINQPYIVEVRFKDSKQWVEIPMNMGLGN